MVLSRRTMRRMDNIKHFCDFDMEEGSATLHLNFQSVDEIIDGRLSTEKEPYVSLEAIGMLEEYLEFIPKEFKVDFQIKISDCKGYDCQKLEEAFKKTMDIRDYNESTGSEKQKSKMGVFVVVGLIFLLFVIFNSRYAWFNSVGLPLSAGIAFVLELAFELYFESGMTHFAVTKLYDKFGNESRFGRISII